MSCSSGSTISLIATKNHLPELEGGKSYLLTTKPFCGYCREMMHRLRWYRKICKNITTTPAIISNGANAKRMSLVKRELRIVWCWNAKLLRDSNIVSGFGLGIRGREIATGTQHPSNASELPSRKQTPPLKILEGAGAGDRPPT